MEWTGQNRKKTPILKGIAALMGVSLLVLGAPAAAQTNHFYPGDSAQTQILPTQTHITRVGSAMSSGPYAGHNQHMQTQSYPPQGVHHGQYQGYNQGHYQTHGQRYVQGQHMVRMVRPVIVRAPVQQTKTRKTASKYKQGFQDFQQWVDYEPQYKINPSDQLDIVVSSAPELSRTLTVGPDGRIVMPMTKPIMAAGRTFEQVQAQLTAQLSKQLRDPTVAVTPRAYSPEQIYVGGEVNQPGTYTLPGRIGALEALFMAGGLQASARSRKVAVLRRAPNGGMMMRVIDIGGGLKKRVPYNDVRQLRRGDIIFVPKSSLAEIGTFVQQVRAAIPVDLSVSYQLGLNNNDNGTIIPTVP